MWIRIMENDGTNAKNKKHGTSEIEKYIINHLNFDTLS